MIPQNLPHPSRSRPSLATYLYSHAVTSSTYCANRFGCSTPTICSRQLSATSSSLIPYTPFTRSSTAFYLPDKSEPTSRSSNTPRVTASIQVLSLSATDAGIGWSPVTPDRSTGKSCTHPPQQSQPQQNSAAYGAHSPASPAHSTPAPAPHQSYQPHIFTARLHHESRRSGSQSLIAIPPRNIVLPSSAAAISCRSHSRRFSCSSRSSRPSLMAHHVLLSASIEGSLTLLNSYPLTIARKLFHPASITCTT